MTMPSEDRLALEDLLTSYCAAIDARADARAAAEHYTLDGVLDNSALGAPPVAGRAALTEAVAGMFAAMASLEHYLSNFLLLSLTAETASAQAYVQAHGKAAGGDSTAMRGVYHMDAASELGTWKIARLTFKPFG